MPSERRARWACTSKLTSRGRRCGQVFVELAQLGAVSSNEMHEARVNIDVEAFFIARNGLLLPRFSLGRHQHPAG